MDNTDNKKIIQELALEYNKEKFFTGDPIIFPKHFAKLYKGKNGIFKEEKCCSKNITLQDVEIAGIIAAHLAWGRRDMIVRDTSRAMDEMSWKPYKYVMEGKYKNDDTSLHRTVKWSEFSIICNNLKEYFSHNTTLEPLTADEIRVKIYGQKSNLKMPNKKIHMFRRWMVRNDGIVDLGLWKNTSPASLIIPLDVHVHRSALTMGITSRKGADFTTATEITEFLKTVFPQDPCVGDFALFAYAATTRENNEKNK
ncbi:MAG: DUF2400 family protein [Bacteroidales bacterium]